MGSDRSISTVLRSESRLGGEPIRSRIGSADKRADCLPGAPAPAAIVRPEQTGSLTFKSGLSPSRGFRSIGTLSNGETGVGVAFPIRKQLITVATVDEDDETRFVLYRILEQSGEFHCVGSYMSGEEAIRRVPDDRPQIVLTEIRLPGISGIECMRRLRGLLPGLIVVMVSGLDDPETMSGALAAGGDGYLTKPFAISQCLAVLTLAVRHCHSGSLDPTATDLLLSARGGCQFTRITEQENAVMDCLAQGLLYKEIADKLGLSFARVHKLQHKIFLKLHVCNRTEAVLKWRSSVRGPGSLCLSARK